MSDYKLGTRVRVKGFPTPTDPFNGFDYNNKIGNIQQIYKVGFGMNNAIVHAYDVYFKDVEVPFVTRLEDGRLDRSIRKTDALNRFDESYLEPME